jgi:hypothetical protein
MIKAMRSRTSEDKSALIDAVLVPEKRSSSR